jgi:glycosyltransferase involved in cell wall biosynthesis
VEAGAPADSVHVIPMGSDHLPPPDEAAASRLLSTMGVDGPFLLSVGTLEPRKNLPRLVDAYERVRSSLPEPWPLVLVGPSGWGARVKPATGVVLTGMVTPPELSALYAMARLLAYVPLEEGFGLPPVEAMALGTPVVASPLPSTAGAAFEVDPLDTDSIAGGLLTVATDEQQRDRLRHLGREHRPAALVGHRPTAPVRLGACPSVDIGKPPWPPWLTGPTPLMRSAPRPCSVCPSTSRLCRPEPSGRATTRCSWPAPWPPGRMWT